jgi:dipeptidyl-peptidase-4
MIIKPKNFNPKEKYPLIFYAYGGVSSQIVINKWGAERHLWHRYLAKKKIIVFSIDNRGTGGRGKKFENY